MITMSLEYIRNIFLNKEREAFVAVYRTGRQAIGRYFCTAEITCSKKGIFLIPLAKRFLFTVGKMARGMSDPIKTERVINPDICLTWPLSEKGY